MTADNTIPFDLAFKEAKERLTVPQLWEILGVDGDPSKKCKSPLRDDSTPSFTIYNDGRNWKDHGTGNGGDIFDFYEKYMEVSKPEAVRAIFQMLKINSVNPGYGWCKPPKKPEVMSLAKPEPITVSDAIPRVPQEGVEFFLSKGICPRLVDKLLYEGSLDVESDRLVFCYNTGKKLRASWESSRENRWIEGGAEDALWRYEEVLRPGVETVFICEGESDAMRVLSALDIPPTVAIVAAPAASWRPSSVLASTIGHGRKVVIAFDNDEAGELGTKEVTKAIEEGCNFNTEVRSFPWRQVGVFLKILGHEPVKDLCELGNKILVKALNACFSQED